MHYSMIKYILSRVLQFQAYFLLIPCIVALIYQEASGWPYLWVALGCFAVGWLGSRKGRKKKEKPAMFAREGFAAVSLSWILLSLTGALPFFLSGEIPHYEDSLFETVAGLTTTGSSILANVEMLSHTNLFWRSFTHWIGGMGVLVLMVAVLPLSGSHNIHLMKAESPGPTVGKLVPRIRYTARILYGIYLGMTAILILLLLVSGMGVFDAFAVGFGTAATGGCFILQTGITTYPIFSQVVITVFMLLFSINFNVYYLFMVKKPKEALKHQETRYYFGAILVATALIVWNSREFFASLPMAIHTAAFQVVSMISSTGYASTDFTVWPIFSQTILLGLMFIGACSGSTGGGIKVARVMVLLKLIKNEVSHLVHPKRMRQVRMEGHVVPQEVWRGIQVFLLSYLMIFALSLLALSLNGMDFTTNFTTVLASMNNVGLGLGLVGPSGNFEIFSGLSKGVLMFDMIAGRLEIFPLLVCLAPSTWRKN